MRQILPAMALAGCLAVLGAQAAPAVRPPELQKLDVAVGQWIFHGKSLGDSSGKTSRWTWHADCRWSADRIYLLCLFHNTWAGRPVKSLVVDTYNSHDKSYWHYEMFAAGASGKHPFSSRMSIKGNTWIEYSQSRENGKTTHERIVYVYVSAKKVDVKIQTSRDGKHWKTVDEGEGFKQPAR